MTVSEFVPEKIENDVEDHLLLQTRDVDFDLSGLSDHYVHNEPFATHWLDVLHLLLPAGEEFFVEVFKEALPLLKDDQLRDDVRGFIGQEAMHSQAHHGVLDHFAARGIDVTPFTRQMNWLFQKALGKRPSWSQWAQGKWMLERVALIAAIEHYTAILGKWVLDAKALDGITDPVMLDLLRWHGAEEVEHKSVAFDVMKHLKAGFFRQLRTQAVITPFLFLLWVRGVMFMYSVDPHLPKGTRPKWSYWTRDAKRGLAPSPMSLIKAISKYFMPKFHPSDLGGVEQAEQYLAISPAARAAY